MRFGYYTPAGKSALDKTQLFTLGQGDAQTTNPTAIASHHRPIMSPSFRTLGILGAAGI